ncbi:MAG: A/G-specific adenine glycosylase [Planctomycetaceae bacterium]|nr:A/G-specific adenine glycosylase [Planctomycetaceae bacterium]
MSSAPPSLDPPPPFSDPLVLEKGIVKPLQAWFDDQGRDLPWRRSTSPWRTLVSEFMLQQTQVSRVEERFETFLERFPTPAAMVDAGEDDVLAAWEGLGYYRRARFLHASAAAIVSEHGGLVPSDAEALLALPGVGRYTAGAIASIAFDQRAPIVDGNVARVVARVGGMDVQADDPDLIAAAWSTSTAMVEATDRPGTLNEAVMELGATVCTPAAPRCDRCPIQSACRGRARGIEREIPRPKVRPVRTVVHIHLVIVRRGEEILLERRPTGGVWGGLWQPIGLESEIELEPRVVGEHFGAWVGSPIPLARVRRLLTHREVHLHLLEAGRPEGDPELGSERETGWFARDRASELGCPKPVRTLLDRFGWPGDKEGLFPLG